MKKSLLLLVTVLLMSATSAQAGVSNTTAAPTLTKHLSMRAAQAKLTDAQRDNVVERLAAPQLITDDGRAEDTDTLITNPVGEKQMYTRTTDSWYLYYYWMYHAYDYGYAQEIVFGNDNDVYFKNPFGGYETNSYIKGTIEGDEIVVTLPQYVLNYKGMKYTAKAAKVELDSDGYVDATEADSQEIRFYYKNGVIKQTTKDVYIAMYGPSNYWVSYADGLYEMSLMKDEPMPDPDLKTAEYSMLYDDNGHHVNVANTDGVFVMQGLCSSLPGAWVKGTVNGNKVTLEPQYLGVFDNHHAYFVPGQLTIDQVQGEYYYTYNLLPELELTYDAEADKYTIPENYSYVINTNLEAADAMDYYDNAVIVRQGDVTVAKPAAPIINDVWLDDDAWEGTNYIDFTILKTDVDGNLLDTDKLYYNIYFDDDIATFFCDDYIYAKEDMTDFPYEYSDGHDVYADGTEHSIYLYGEGFDKIGVQTIYKSSNGEEYRSDITYYYTTGISDVTISKAIKSVEYFDLTGRLVTTPSNGIYLKRVNYTDGSFVTSKQVVK